MIKFLRWFLSRRNVPAMDQSEKASLREQNNGLEISSRHGFERDMALDENALKNGR